MPANASLSKAASGQPVRFLPGPRTTPSKDLLHGDISAQTLSGAEPSRTGTFWQSIPPDTESSGVIRKYRYNEFGKEHEVEFDEAHMNLSGTFDSVSSQGYGEYQARIKAIQLRKEGKSKSEIAAELGRPEKFVSKWWQMEVKEVPRPMGVHQYLAFGMDQNGGQFDKTDVWRGVEVVRGFVTDTEGLYDIISSTVKWKAQVSETKDFRTASYFLRYDRDGKMKFSSMKSGGYEHGSIPKVDKIIQQMFKHCGIDDPTHGVGAYWFTSGDACVGSHRHPRWSARIAFGAERIMMIDKTPLLMQEGDLVIIGPQRHGLPPMPDITEGSLRLSFQYMPRHKHKDGKKRNRQDETGQSGQREEGAGDDIIREKHKEDLEQLSALGFDEHTVLGALKVFGFDVERAADALLVGTSELLSDFAVLGGSSTGTGTGASADASEERRKAPDGGWYTQREFIEHYGGVEEWAIALRSNEDSENSDVDDDEALARSLQRAEMYGNGDDSEEESDLKGQFAEYEKILDLEDAEKSWDGYGDLMHNNYRRAHLNLDNIGPQALFSIGTGTLTEKHFFQLLSLHSIRVLYDFRATNYQDEVFSSQVHFDVRALKATCRTRGIWYRHVAVGKESAYGILRHLSSEEVQHILVELVWQAKHRGRTAFLGTDEDWRNSHRLVIAEELVKHGHQVSHIATDGSPEVHEAGIPMPENIMREEAKLRKVDAMRKAGELKRPEKSSVDRSTEAVARTLTTDKVEFDIAAELRDAENQTDLVRAQRKVVRMQIAENKKEVGLSKKKLVGAPQFVLDAAQEEQARIEVKKAEKAKARYGEKSGKEAQKNPFDDGPAAFSSSSASSASTSASASFSSSSSPPVSSNSLPVQTKPGDEKTSPSSGTVSGNCNNFSEVQAPEMITDISVLPESGASTRKSRWNSGVAAARAGKWDGSEANRQELCQSATGIAEEPESAGAGPGSSASAGAGTGNVSMDVDAESGTGVRPRQSRWSKKSDLS